MKKAGRPSRAPKKLKDGYYMLVSVPNSKTPIRIMRETPQQVEQAKTQYKHYNITYLGQVKDDLWIDGEKKGQRTV